MIFARTRRTNPDYGVFVPISDYTSGMKLYSYLKISYFFCN